MRTLLAALASLTLANCASAGEPDFVVGEEERALIVIGVAEAASTAEPSYTMLWRRVDPGATSFGEWEDERAFEARTSVRGTVRVRGIPGEFTFVEVPPGIYALDSVFADLNVNRVSYFANGVVVGPERPAFEVRAGEAIYLGIWEARLNDTSSTATTSLWRLDSDDLRAAMQADDNIRGQVRLRETHTISVNCAPQRMSSMSQRQVC